MAERKNSEARIRANNKYAAKAYDRINIAVPKGRKDKVKALADIRGQSINAYIISALDEKMERDGGGGSVAKGDGIAGGPQKAAESTVEAGVVSLPSDTLKAAEQAAKRTGETVVDFVARAVAEQQRRDDRSFKMGINPA